MAIKIENIVASINLDTEIPLPQLLSKLKGSEYEPEQFPGLVYRVQEPRAAMLIFSSGKIVCTGARSLESIDHLFKKVVKLLASIGVKVPKQYEIQVENMVVSTKLGKELNLNRIVEHLPTAEYEPEQFPGLVYRMEDPRVVCLLFASGKMICTGAHSLTDAKKAINFVLEKLREIKVVK